MKDDQKWEMMIIVDGLYGQCVEDVGLVEELLDQDVYHLGVFFGNKFMFRVVDQDP